VGGEGGCLVTAAGMGVVRLMLALSPPSAIVGAVKFADGEGVLARPGVLSIHANVPLACNR